MTNESKKIENLVKRSILGLVEDIMTASVLMVATDTEVKEVARQMVDARVHRALIADEDGVCGIVTTFDLLRLLL